MVTGGSRIDLAFQQKPDDSTTTVQIAKKADKQFQLNGNTNFPLPLHISLVFLFIMNSEASFKRKKETVR